MDPHSNRVSLYPLRMRLVYLSTMSMLATILVFPLVYVFRAPLDFGDFLRLLQQILPVFIGFLVAAIGYAFGTHRERLVEIRRYEMIGFILLWSFVAYWLGVIVIGGLYIFSHSHYAPIGKGMEKDTLFTFITILLSGITGMTGLISTKIFFEDDKVLGKRGEGNLGR